jgi:hypothetical protein
MKKKYLFALAALLLPGLGLVSQSFAHHSFSVYYDSAKIIKVEGVVDSFRFSNPHAIIKLKAVADDGTAQIWTIETTAPVFMARRGWSRDTIKPGDAVVIEGWHSRDGSNLMRMRAVFRPDGTQIGGSGEANDD